MSLSELDRILKVFCNHFSISTPDAAFELLSCTTLFSVSPYYAIEHCWNHSVQKDGSYSTDSQDGKVDGYFVTGNDKQITINVMQAKHTHKVSLNEIQLFFGSVNNHLIKLNSNLPEEYKSLEKIIILIKEMKQSYPSASLKYNLYVSSNADTERINDIKKLFDNEFDNKENIFLLCKNYTDILNKVHLIRKNILNGITNNTTINLEAKTMTRAVNYSKSKVVISVLQAREIKKLITYEFEKNFELSRLFSGNVRGFLDMTDVNQSMKNTIENASKTFLSKNNGVVMVCDKVNVQPASDSLNITNPIIVNGQQTVSTIYKYAKTESSLENVEVLVKFIELNVENKNTCLLDIARASNQSNNIDNLDLLSNRPLFKELVKEFGSENLYLKVKDGELLNEVFLKGIETINFNDLLQIWVSVYLKRPSDGKTVRKNVDIFTKAYNNERYQQLVSDNNVEKVKQMFKYSYEIFKFKETVIKTFFKDELYYEHAQYFILYLLNEIRPSDVINATDDDLQNIKNIMSELIEHASIRKKNENKEFTFNNYFKSIQPQQDYLARYGNGGTIQKIDQMIETLFSNQE